MSESLVVDFEQWVKAQIVATLGPDGDYDDLHVETVLITVVRNAGDWITKAMPLALVEVARVERQIKSHGTELLTFEKQYPVTIVLATEGDQETAPRDAKILEARLENMVRSWKGIDLADSRGERVTRIKPGATIWQSLHADSTTVANKRFGVAIATLTLETLIAS